MPGWGSRTRGRDHRSPGPQTHLSHLPPCSQRTPSLGGPPGSRCCQPHWPTGVAPHGGPPPAGAASASSPCLPASCPSWEQEGTRGGKAMAEGDKGARPGCEARQTLTGPDLSWAKVRGRQGQAGRGSPLVRGHSLGPGQGPRLQHTVLVHDLLHQLLLLSAQGVELVPGRGAGEQHEARQQQGSGSSRHSPAAGTRTHACVG